MNQNRIYFENSRVELAVDIGDPDSNLYRALKHAMSEYMPLQDFYKRGTFFGLDEIGLKSADSVVGADTINGGNERIDFLIEISPMSPALVKVNIDTVVSEY